MTRHIHVDPVEGLPEVREGDSLGALVCGRASLTGGDVLVIAQKVVSKAEGRIRSLAAVEVGAKARDLAERLGKDPRFVQLVLEETRRLIRAERGVLIVETHAGWICANAGIDASNVPGDENVVLLPQDGDVSASRIRREIESACGVRPAVVISDSFGRPWRRGQAEVAIGAAGVAPLLDWRGRFDREGRELAATVVALADLLAGTAELARDKDEGVPVAVIRGLEDAVTAEDGPGARAIQRPATEDLFRE